MHVTFALLGNISFRRISIRWTLSAAAILSGACTPIVYKPDVQRLSADIDSATNSFKKLVADNPSHDLADRNSSFVDNKTRLALDPNCAKIEAFIRDQNECLTGWSEFRHNASKMAKPNCAEPVPFTPIPPELKQCRIGKLERGAFVPVRVATVNDAQNHLRLAEALATYAAQLNAIVSATDGDVLEVAAADAGAAAQSLQNKLAAADQTAKTMDVGPIASFIGTGLRLALEAKRFAILKNVVEKADPVVQQVSGQLSIFSNQLYYVNELQPAFSAFEKAVQRSVPEPSSTFPARVQEATVQEQAYAATLAVTPSEVFKAVADSHHNLVAALNDPSRQIDALKQSIATLNTKVKALAAVLKASETRGKTN